MSVVVLVSAAQRRWGKKPLVGGRWEDLAVGRVQSCWWIWVRRRGVVRDGGCWAKEV